jgi:PAS domain S-box-containing protein
MTITKVNRSALNATGYDENELLGKNVNILMADRPFNIKGVRILRKKGSAADIDQTIRRKDGTSMPASMSLSVFKDDEGEDLGIVCVGKDISDRKQADAERQVIAEIIHGVATTANIEEFLQLAHRSIARLVYAENFYVALLNPKTEMLSMQFFVDKHDPTQPPAKLGKGLTAYVLRTGSPTLLTADDIRELAAAGKVEIVGTEPAAWLGIPLRTPNGVIGVLVVQRYEDKDLYTRSDLNLMATIGDQIALAIERKRVEEELRESEEQHRLLFESNPHPSFVIDLENLTFLAVNESACLNYGYSRDEFLTALKIGDLRSKQDASDLMDRISRAKAGQDIILEPSKHQKKDGTAIDVEVTMHALTFAGRPAQIVMINDVTSRRRLEAESEVTSEIIQGVASTGSLDESLRLIHQSIGRILYAENCFVALYHPTTNQLSFEFWADKFDPIPEPSTVGKSFSSYVLRTGKPLLLTKELETEMFASGVVERVGSASASWLAVPLKTPERTIGVVVVQHYEVEGAYSQQDLAFLVSVGDQIAMAIERKRSEVQLNLFNEKLQKSNRELQDFAYVASHDLQEPLRKVQAFSDRLKTKYSDKLEGDGLDYLERMRSAANRMQLLIQDLLMFSRVSTKAQPFSAVDLNTVANEVLSDLEVKIEETGATVEIDNMPLVDADPMQMRQLIQNLVGNALKFRKSDITPVINICSKFANLSGGKSDKFLEISVTDNGIGFDEKYADKIFAVFQRLHGRTEYEGSGVGLAICRKIVERHNGTIVASSRPGEGATFTFTLPVKQSEPMVTT